MFYCTTSVLHARAHLPFLRSFLPAVPRSPQGEARKTLLSLPCRFLSFFVYFSMADLRDRTLDPPCIRIHPITNTHTVYKIFTPPCSLSAILFFNDIVEAARRLKKSTRGTQNGNTMWKTFLLVHLVLNRFQKLYSINLTSSRMYDQKKSLIGSGYHIDFRWDYYFDRACQNPLGNSIKVLLPTAVPYILLRACVTDSVGNKPVFLHDYKCSDKNGVLVFMQLYTADENITN